MKKFIFKLCLLSLLITPFFTYTAKAIPTLEAEGVVLMDAKTGDIIYSKNPNVQFEPASTTKVMTALVVLDNSNLDDKVTIGVNPTLVDGSAIGLFEGQVYTVKELLLGLLLESGNDCAEALAEHIAGSNSEFAKLMTSKAKELGANDTVFKNPSGLHEAGHITTAYDLSLIMKEALKNKDFVEISRTPYYILKNHPNPDGTEKWINNRNHCLNDFSPYYYEYLYSGKVGYTPEANHTYTAAAMKDGQVLVASFLNAVNKDTQFMSVGQLFDYGFENFETVKIINKNEEVADYQINDNITIPLLAENDIYYTKNRGTETPKVKVTYNYKNIKKTIIKKGDILFTGNILINDKEYTTVDLISGAERDYTYKIALKESFSDLKNHSNILIISSILVIVFTSLIYNYFRSTKKRKRIAYRKKLRK